MALFRLQPQAVWACLWGRKWVFFHRHYLLLLFFIAIPMLVLIVTYLSFQYFIFFLLFISHFTSWTNQITCFLIYFGSGYNDVFMHTDGTGGKILIIYKWSGGGGHWANHNEPLCCCFHSKASIIMNVLLQIYIYIYLLSVKRYVFIICSVCPFLVNLFPLKAELKVLPFAFSPFSLKPQCEGTVNPAGGKKNQFKHSDSMILV